MLKWREALWTFVQVEGVEPTNNTAERSIRPGVPWRKGSFGTQSEDGSRFVESMMTVVATLKPQQRHVLAYLTAAPEATLWGEAAPSLMPAREMESQAAA
jgi:transposase